MIFDIDIDIDKTSLKLLVDGKQQRASTPEDLWDAIWSMCAREARRKAQSSGTSLRLIDRKREGRVDNAVEEDVVEGEVVDEETTGRSSRRDASSMRQPTDAAKRSLRDRLQQDGAEKVVDEVFDEAMVHIGVEAFRMTVGAVGAVQNLFSKKKNRKKKRTASAQEATTNAPRGHETRIRKWAP